MKKFLFILLSILYSYSAIGQMNIKMSANQNPQYMKLKYFHGDTLSYVQHNFIDNKQKYVGKALNAMLKDIEIPIVSYLEGVSMENNFIVTHIYLQFNTQDQNNHRIFSAHNPVDIIITWPEPLSKESVDSLHEKTHGLWNKAAREYFGPKITADVLTTKWTK